MNPPDLTPNVYLIPLPCGCIADQSHIYVSDNGKNLECPWCESTFSAKEFGEWLDDLTPQFNTRDPYMLVKFGLDLFELIEWHSCGAPIVRKCGTMERIHLAVPREFIQKVGN